MCVVFFTTSILFVCLAFIFYCILFLSRVRLFLSMCVCVCECILPFSVLQFAFFFVSLFCLLLLLAPSWPSRRERGEVESKESEPESKSWPESLTFRSVCVRVCKCVCVFAFHMFAWFCALFQCFFLARFPVFPFSLTRFSYTYR